MRDTEVADRIFDPLPKPSALSRAARPASASNALGFERATGHRSRPIRLVSSSRTPVLKPRATADEHWLAGLEARLADHHEGPVAVSAASDTSATVPDPEVAVGHWLAGLEAADEQDVHKASPSTAACSAPVESRLATARSADPEDPPSPVDSRPELDDWLDSVEVVAAVMSDRRGVRVKRRTGDIATARADERHPDELGVAPPHDDHDDQPATALTLAELVARLGDMAADLSRVEVSLSNSDAAFSRVVNRWHPVAVPLWIPTGEH